MRSVASCSFAAAIAVAAVTLSQVAIVRAQTAPAAQAAPATNAVRSVGTVRSVGGGSLTVQGDKGESSSFTLPDNVRVVQLAPGSTDLKTAQPAATGDIAVGDRVLVSGRPADSGNAIALRVVLMKSSAIAQNNASRQQDWQRRGSGGVVKAVDTSANTLTLTAGTRTETVTTTTATTFRRYAPGSVKFEDAKASRLDEIQPSDQVRVRGEKSADGATIAAEEVVSGSFRNLAGTVSKVDASASSLTLTDLATKKPVTVAVSGDSDLRSLPPEMAARFAARARGGAAASGNGGAGAAGARPGYAGGNPGNAPTNASDPAAAQGSRPNGGGPARMGGGGGDLSQIIARLPKQPLADLKPGEAVMVVASGEGSSLTAITLLSGVEPLLTASPQGGANSFSISPWNLGGGGEGGEGSGPQ